jgi:hypothetical protein
MRNYIDFWTAHLIWNLQFDDFVSSGHVIVVSDSEDSLDDDIEAKKAATFPDNPPNLYWSEEFRGKRYLLLNDAILVQLMVINDGFFLSVPFPGWIVDESPKPWWNSDSDLWPYPPDVVPP